MQNPHHTMPSAPITADNYLMRPINQRLPNTNNSNSASLPSQTGTSLNDPAFRPASVINLSHSNDVCIGPMTQYQGAVTIYQYMDATVEASIGRMPNGTIGPGIRSNNNSKDVEDKCTIFDKKHLQTWILVFVLMVIIAGVAVAIFLSLRTSLRSERQQSQDILIGKEFEDNTH
ncbi:peptidoglycan-recognition protein LA-like [Bradysia coprophila]|uniref:peptidoglycan-recognition protein LA-like n=1 Tax=Bradysia coprophila TaxID=38358 RepID=UPI00187D8588|nr:peptidoglycan-recognition protein LA-like [Bradysia coprophila]XP_037045336.1 peptidoglycan-recognition protein LA-like [Bradysia coprophila]